MAAASKIVTETTEPESDIEQGYALLFAENTVNLNKFVNARLAKGYVLYGFPYRANDRSYQAVVLPKLLNKSQQES